ncbi:hypothetical protein BGZ65_003861, partial [Modicella reniformis]
MSEYQPAQSIGDSQNASTQPHEQRTSSVISTPAHPQRRLSSSSSSPSAAPSADPVLSPPNQPRLSLSTQLPPDYHNWVNDISTPPSTRSKVQKGRDRRENQPSLTGSVFTNSDNEDYGNHGEGRGEVQHDRPQAPVGSQSHTVNQVAVDQERPSAESSGLSKTQENNSNAESASTARLPSLSKSRIQVTDPSRPAFKMGAPITPKTPTPPARNNAKVGDIDQSTESSALLGNYSQPKDPQENGGYRWTNEGSRRRTPRYTDPSLQSDLDHLDEDGDDTTLGDSLRRPSRARSLSPTMELRRGGLGDRGRVMFRNPSSSQPGRRRNNKTFHNLHRTSIANIKENLKEKLLPRRSMVYDDAKEALVKENNGIRIWYHNYTTIDWIHDFVKERVRLRHLRSIGGIRGLIKNRADGLKGWILVLLTGVITACLAAFIDVSSWWLGDLRMGYCTTNFWWSQYFCCWGSSGSICVVMVTSDGTVSQQRSHGATKRRNGVDNLRRASSASRVSVESVLLASQPKKIAYFGAGSGIPEVKTILGGFVIRGFLGFRTLMIKLIGLPLMVASGLNMGKQGPLVHIACCVANIVCRFFDKYNRNDGKRREILSAAAASGVAVAFGAPIGGVLFSLEEVSYYFPSKTMWRAYFCALISAVVLKMINPYRVGKTVLFQVTYDRDWHLFESIPFFLISVFG